jgi:hypothetical protein
MQKVVGEVYQLSLGDVKAIFFITTLQKQCIPLQNALGTAGEIKRSIRRWVSTHSGLMIT